MIHCFPQHTTIIMVILPPLFRMQDFGFGDAHLWHNIDQNYSQPFSETKRMEANGIVYSGITIKHDDLILDFFLV